MGYQSDVTTPISKAVPTEFCYHIRHTTGIGVVIGDESSCSRWTISMDEMSLPRYGSHIAAPYSRTGCTRLM